MITEIVAAMIKGLTAEEFNAAYRELQDACTYEPGLTLTWDGAIADMACAMLDDAPQDEAYSNALAQAIEAGRYERLQYDLTEALMTLARELKIIS